MLSLSSFLSNFASGKHQAAPLPLPVLKPLGLSWATLDPIPSGSWLSVACVLEDKDLAQQPGLALGSAQGLSRAWQHVNTGRHYASDYPSAGSCSGLSAFLQESAGPRAPQTRGLPTITARCSGPSEQYSRLVRGAHLADLAELRGRCAD